MLATQIHDDFNINPVDEALAYHDGDAIATIETLLADIGFLRQQLAMATALGSRGYTRGWVPPMDREA